MFLVMVKCLMSSGLSSKMFQTVFSLLFLPGSRLDACKVFTHPAPNSYKTVKGLKSMNDLKFQAFQYTSKRAYPEVELYFLQNSLHSKLSLSGTLLAIFKDLYNYILTNMFFKVIQQWLLIQRAYSGMVREVELWVWLHIRCVTFRIHSQATTSVCKIPCYHHCKQPVPQCMGI